MQPGNAAADGVDGDTVVLAPPFVITGAQIDEMVRLLGNAVAAVSCDLGVAPQGGP